MRTLTMAEQSKVAGGRQFTPLGPDSGVGVSPDVIKEPGPGDAPPMSPAQQVSGITDSFMASVAMNLYNSTLSNNFFTVAHPEAATQSQLNDTCSILESDCTHWETTGTHLDDFTGSTIDPSFIDWSAYGSSLGDAGAITFIENLDNMLAEGNPLTVDPNFGNVDNMCVEYSVDQDFIYGLENAQDTLVATVPEPNTSQSGVTIAHGFDLGQHNLADLQAIGLPASLIDTLSPYLGLQGYFAQSYLAANPLVLTPAQAYLIDSSDWSHYLNTLATNYVADSDGTQFYDLPPDTQTAIASVQFQYGDNGAKDPKFWADVTSGDWQAAYNELLNFGDGQAYVARHQQEAALIKHDIDAGILP